MTTDDQPVPQDEIITLRLSPPGYGDHRATCNRCGTEWTWLDGEDELQGLRGHVCPPDRTLLASNLGTLLIIDSPAVQVQIRSTTGDHDLHFDKAWVAAHNVEPDPVRPGNTRITISVHHAPRSIDDAGGFITQETRTA